MGRPRKVDIIGNVYGYLTVIDRAKSYSKDKKWDCICICGKTHGVTRQRLENGTTKSCGCMKKALAREKSVKHGGYRDGKNTPEYQSYIAMMHRCYDDKRLGWDRYGGRGITVCESWRLPGDIGLLNFINDMSETYSSGLELDRRDNDKGYCKENCRWVTSSQNNMNTRGRKNSSSKYKGVWWSSRGKVWVAELRINGKRHFREYFKDEVEAAKRYNQVALEIFGEFANINILD